MHWNQVWVPLLGKWMPDGSYGSSPDAGLAQSPCAHTRWMLRLGLSRLWGRLLSTGRFWVLSLQSRHQCLSQRIAQPRGEGSDFSSVLQEHLLRISSDSIPPLPVGNSLLLAFLKSPRGGPESAGSSPGQRLLGRPFPALRLYSRTVGFRGVTAPNSEHTKRLFSDPDQRPWRRRFTSRGRPRFLPYTPAGGRHPTLQPFRTSAASSRPLPRSALQSFSAQAPLTSVDAGLRLGSSGPWHGQSVQVWFACRKLTGALSAEPSKLSFCPSQWTGFTGCRNLPSYSSLPCMQAISFLPPYFVFSCHPGGALLRTFKYLRFSVSILRGILWGLFHMEIYFWCVQGRRRAIPPISPFWLESLVRYNLKWF